MSDHLLKARLEHAIAALEKTGEKDDANAVRELLADVWPTSDRAKPTDAEIAAIEMACKEAAWNVLEDIDRNEQDYSVMVKALIRAAHAVDSVARKFVETHEDVPSVEDVLVSVFWFWATGAENDMDLEEVAIPCAGAAPYVAYGRFRVLRETADTLEVIAMEDMRGIQIDKALTEAANEREGDHGE